MNSRLKVHYEKILTGLAVLSLAVSSVWLGQQQRELHRLRAVPVAAQMVGL
ncbi:MAG: hypothetical protein PSV13_13740 [Lacunisphaera sp.]|nr:hypothetical protein [Lacunisphaera sp.]